jgi:hypothetical protein
MLVGIFDAGQRAVVAASVTLGGLLLWRLLAPRRRR